jgi:GTP-binding protein
MKFIDEVEITIQSGKGGDGCVSLRRERFIPRGGPDGGDGGRGGSIIFVADAQLSTLLDHRYTRHYRAKNGQPGMGNDRNGASAEDIIVSVPLGTQVYDIESGSLLGDLDRVDEKLVVARGGKGGRGNVHFKSPTNQTPRKAETGEPGERLKIRLELKLLADVGVVGFPNTGKSTLVSRISKAKPKIADYPFTTLVPTLGMVSAGDHDGFVIADVPGLIEGAHKGTGLGHKFLRHVERCRVLVHLLSWEAGEEPDAKHLIQRFEILEEEMKLFAKELSEKPRLVAISKIDLPEIETMIADLEKHFQEIDIPLLTISSVSGQGLDKLIEKVYNMLR